MANDVEHILERLRSGVVPHRSLETFAVGIEKSRAEINRQLDLAQSKEGAFKFLRGGYGCGKTFMSRLALLDAHSRNFAASFVVVSENDLQFHKFDEVYRRIMQELSTAYCDRQALSDILDRWIGRVEEALVNTGLDEDAPDFDERVAKRLEEDLVARTAGKVPQDMVRVLSTIFRLKQERKNHEAGGLLSWLCGSRNVDASIKRLAGLRGDISSSNALDYLHGILEIIKAADYQGLVVVIDEAETILRSRRDVRGKTLNGIRQIIDASDRFRGMLWIFTGTPDFFDTTRGVAGLAPLHDRIAFQKNSQFVNVRQPQLELRPFDAARLKAVALKLRELYPTQDRGRLERKVSEQVIESLVHKATRKFGGDVGVVPRQFLRSFVTMLDLVDQEEAYDPATMEGLDLGPITPEEERLVEGKPEYDPEPEDQQEYELVQF
ncbi:BREX system ATP-binding protein BrxD [bacterium]|nr:BREX system ATP-binding protein BrxD [bacterium]